MPTYEFGCTDCGQHVEVRASFAQKDRGLDVRCPACDGQNLRRAYSALPMVGAVGSGGRGGTSPAPTGGGGGCCGGGCCG